MSYCGACGKFYSPSCPGREDGLCLPAPNPYEGAALKTKAAIAVFEATISGMVAENEHRARRNLAPAYGEEAFDVVTTNFREEIKAIGLVALGAQ